MRNVYDSSKLTFDQHISDLFEKATRKLTTLVRVAPYLNISKRQFRMKLFSGPISTVFLEYGFAIVVKTMEK